MSPLLRLATSSLGRKYVMAVTGLGLLLFVVGHMLGNLQIFLGPKALNEYAHFLKSNPEILWPARVGLLVMVVLHIVTGISLAIENLQARPAAYEVREVVDASWASRTMVVSGLVILSFVLFHLAHYTWQIIHPEYRHLERDGLHDVYGMVVAGFSSPWVAGFYVVSVGLMCFHLGHGIGALCQSLGLKNAVYARRIDGAGKTVAVLLFLGYTAVPVAVWTGMVK